MYLCQIKKKKFYSLLNIYSMPDIGDNMVNMIKCLSS